MTLVTLISRYSIECLVAIPLSKSERTHRCLKTYLARGLEGDGGRDREVVERTGGILVPGWSTSRLYCFRAFGWGLG